MWLLQPRPSARRSRGPPLDPAPSWQAAPARYTRENLMDLPRLPGDRADHVRQLTRQLAEPLLTRLQTQPPPVEEIIGEGLARLRETLDTYRNGVPIDETTAIQLAWDLHILRIRDEAWLAVAAEPITMTGLLGDLAVYLDRPFLTPVSLLWALAVWRQGDSRSAYEVVTAVLVVSPFNTMAHLIAAAIRLGVPAKEMADRMPTPAGLDAEMGPPEPAWLLPLTTMLSLYLRAADN
ncbi:DUF4192 family protein [Nonomuraea wenchangensis]|uniref:DUF4192 family protein n=1 Tax=Nonomuraea wenchangensis TaxID=568860 RepID=UPI00331EEEE9